MQVNNLGNNQQAIVTDKEICFFSYGTKICTVTNFQNGNKPVIEVTEGQPESRTTGKYLNKFLSIYTDVKHYKDIK